MFEFDEQTQKRIWATVLLVSFVAGILLLIATGSNHPQFAWMWQHQPPSPSSVPRLQPRMQFSYLGTSLIFGAFALVFVSAIRLFMLSEIYQKTEDD